MKYNVTYSTLAPVHVGNGEELQRGFEFSEYENGDQNYLGIWDIKKLREAMQADQFNRVLRILAAGDPPERYISEVIPRNKWASLFGRKMQLVDPVVNTLKPHIHDGFGKVYLPGSAIKGAILTAILAKEAQKIPASLLNGLNRKDLEKTLWKKSLGEDFSYLINRFIKVGDVNFSAYQSQAWLGGVLNLNQENLFTWKQGTDQLAECIPYNIEAQGRIVFDQTALKVATQFPNKKGRKHQVFHKEFVQDLGALIQVLNESLSYWLKAEQDFIRNYNGISEEVEDALRQYNGDLSDLQESLESLSSQQAIIRVGAGSGYKGLSGSVLDRLKDSGGITAAAKKQMMESLRKARYRNTPFPKTRKLFKDGVAWGFIKLTFNES